MTLSYFNPRPLAGATGISGHQHQHGRDFNPRPLAGATYDCYARIDGSGISIHAPLRGRLMDVKHEAVLKIFQSTPPCGGDVFGPKAVPFQTNFNPRPLAGATAGKAG